MSKPYHHGDLRKSLLDAAEAILDRDGIGALSLRAAAREAGVSHAAPAHHFGDLAGLLSALAASGFVRFRAAILARADAAGTDPAARLSALSHGYIAFARASPGLFRLMFRSERLDWSSSTLAAAADAAFALLTADKPAHDVSSAPQNLALAISRWALVHGLATLLLDGRLEPLTAKVEGADLETLINDVLARLLHQG